MKCPKCRLESPAGALRCDCGYDFPSGQMKASYLAAKKEPRPDPQGIAGWLLIPAIGLIIGIPLAFVGLARSLDSGKTGEAAAVGFAGVLLVATALAFFRKHRSTPRLFVALLSLSVLSNTLQVAATGNPARFAGAIGPIVWIAYFLTSRRVRATFKA